MASPHVDRGASLAGVAPYGQLTTFATDVVAFAVLAKVVAETIGLVDEFIDLVSKLVDMVEGRLRVVDVEPDGAIDHGRECLHHLVEDHRAEAGRIELFIAGHGTSPVLEAYWSC